MDYNIGDVYYSLDHNQLLIINYNTFTWSVMKYSDGTYIIHDVDLRYIPEKLIYIGEL